MADGFYTEEKRKSLLKKHGVFDRYTLDWYDNQLPKNKVENIKDFKTDSSD